MGVLSILKVDSGKGYLKLQQKSIAMKIAINIFSECCNKLTPIVTLYYVPRILGVEQFGYAQFAINLIELTLPLIVFGYVMVGAIEIGMAKNSPLRARAIVTNIFYLRILHAVVVSLGIWTLATFHPHYRMYQPIVVALLFVLLLTPLDMLYVGIGMQNLHKLNVVQALIRLTSLAGILIWVKSPQDATLYASLLLGANTCFAIYTGYVAMRLFPLTRPNWLEMQQLFVKSSKFAGITFLAISLERFDVFIAEHFFGTAAMGLYAAPSRLGHSTNQLAMAISMIFFSEMIGVSDQNTFTKHVHSAVYAILGVLAPVCAGIWFIKEDLLSALFGPDFISMGFPLGAIMMGTGFNALFFIFGIQVLVLRGDITRLSAILMGSITAGLLLSLVLKTQFGLDGVAFAAASAKFAALAGSIIMAKKYFQPLPVTEILASIAPAGLMTLLLLALDLANHWINVPVGCISYVIFYVLLNRQKSRNIINLLRKQPHIGS
jgi:PST family polysaccharide transporter